MIAFLERSTDVAKRVPSKQKVASAVARLDEALPMAEPEQLEVHRGSAVLEVSSPAQLLELGLDRAFVGIVLCRLSPTVALIDPGRSDELIEILRRRGHTPKVN
jgi:hypothetical protein